MTAMMTRVFGVKRSKDESSFTRKNWYTESSNITEFIYFTKQFFNCIQIIDLVKQHE